MLLTREPGGTPLGERIRDVLLHAREVPLTPQAQALLFSAARAQNVHDVIAPALREGRVVIADRFYDSTFVYQGLAESVSRIALEAITSFAVGDVRPDRTYVLDLPVDVALARRHAADRAWDRFEAEGGDFHERLRQAYLELAAREPGRIRVIDASRDEAAVHGEVRRDLEVLLSGERR